ncbi:biotin-dependent carboxyltransferase family protein [Flexivirga caeni]|uniref:Biotin-dependent carboxyltransferase n=1 Tax=Flexivirga caeni TaxID=2294115 RepID=A0A3M9M8K4_9MICO|nr:biotin-dependent carboxyltransferase family protein [Flexivirga caeni]RNI21545.1 biotin-dependent carboxyltransferase [Flexivirga caeni]
MTEVEILATGPQCLVEDLGRPGHAGEGVTLSGALDRRSLRQANLLVGNEIDAPGLEMLLGEVTFRADGDVLVAVTGAWCPVSIDDVAAEFGTPVPVPARSVLRVGRAEHGLRSYLAVRGGLAPAGAFAGSWSTDTSSGIGPPPVQAGIRLPVGRQTAGAPLAVAVPPATRPVGDLTLTLTPGPRAGSIDADARRRLVTNVGHIDSASDRIGIRINGFDVDPAPGTGASEALPLGAVQAPPSGELIVFLADHPTTGGYPVIGVVDLPDLDRLAQCAPGQPVRFTLRGALSRSPATPPPAPRETSRRPRPARHT